MATRCAPPSAARCTKHERPWASASTATRAAARPIARSRADGRAARCAWPRIVGCTRTPARRGQVLADPHRVADRLGHDRDGGAGRRQLAERAGHRVEVDGALRARAPGRCRRPSPPRRRGSRWARPGSGRGTPGRAASARSRAAGRWSRARGRSRSPCRWWLPVPSMSRSIVAGTKRHGHGVGEHPRPERGAVAADHDQGVEAERLERLEAGVAAGRASRAPSSGSCRARCPPRARAPAPRRRSGEPTRRSARPGEAALDAVDLAAEPLRPARTRRRWRRSCPARPHRWSGRQDADCPGGWSAVSIVLVLSSDGLLCKRFEITRYANETIRAVRVFRIRCERWSAPPRIRAMSSRTNGRRASPSLSLCAVARGSASLRRLSASPSRPFARI